MTSGGCSLVALAPLWWAVSAEAYNTLHFLFFSTFSSESAGSEIYAVKHPPKKKKKLIKLIQSNKRLKLVEPRLIILPIEMPHDCVCFFLKNHVRASSPVRQSCQTLLSPQSHM